jgi:superfamily II DNA/RNA helicase
MQDEAITSNPSTQAGSAIEQFTSDAELIDKIRSIGFGQLTEFQAKVIPLILAGRDIVAEGGRRGRTLAYLIPLAALKEKEEKGRTLIVTDSEADAERIARNAHDLGLPSAKIGGRQKGPRNPLLSATVIVGTTQGFLDAFDEGTMDGAKVHRVVLDGTEHAVQSGRTEELLNLLHDLPTTQIAMLRKDGAANLVNFIKKFFKTPETV